MKPVLCCLLLFAVKVSAQRDFSQDIPAATFRGIFNASTMQKPPVFPFGIDSCKRFYFTHFEGFDSVLTKTVERGDTAKYIRVCFSFVIDKNGVPYDAHFERISSTQYARSDGSKTIKYFFDDKKYYEDIIKKMCAKMPFWKPGLYNTVPVDARVEDYIQFWVGLVPPSS